MPGTEHRAASGPLPTANEHRGVRGDKQAHCKPDFAWEEDLSGRANLVLACAKTAVQAPCLTGELDS